MDGHCPTSVTSVDGAGIFWRISEEGCQVRALLFDAAEADAGRLRRDE
jgi:hypothetical protein